MMTISLLEYKHVKAALKAGYQYAHLGMVRIGMNALHRKGQKAYVFSALFDNRWTTFTQAMIGGIETSLSDGPIQYDVFPDFSVALDDPNVLQCLTLGIQTVGYEESKTKSKIWPSFTLPVSDFIIQQFLLYYILLTEMKAESLSSNMTHLAIL